MTCSLYREKLSLYFEFTTCGCDVIRATAPVQRRGRGWPRSGGWSGACLDVGLRALLLLGAQQYIRRRDMPPFASA